MKVRRLLTGKRILTFLIALVGFALPAMAAETEFRLTVTGMGCSQCVYALEQALQHTHGVKDAIVDLRSRSVVVKVDPSNPPSAEALAQSARGQKFSLAKLEATLVGRIEQTSNGWQLIAGSRRFNVSPTDDGPGIDAFINRIVVLEGMFDGIEDVEGATKSARFVPLKVTAF